MKKYLIITISVLLIFLTLLSGCTQENDNVNKDEIQLISHKIETNTSGDVKEVT